jgi:predicted transcriptional regulator
LTQVQLAKRAKVTRGYLAQLEAGHKMNRRYPRCASSPGRSACR